MRFSIALGGAHRLKKLRLIEVNPHECKVCEVGDASLQSDEQQLFSESVSLAIQQQSNAGIERLPARQRQAEK